IAVPVDLRRQDRAVPLVDPVADGLPDEMCADRPDVQAVPLEQGAPIPGVAGIGDCLINLEVVAPAGQLEPVEAPARAARGQLVEGEVGPLAGEQRDGTRHQLSFGTGTASPGAPSSEVV